MTSPKRATNPSTMPRVRFTDGPSFPLVAIAWKDHHSFTESIWRGADDFLEHELAIIYSTGYLIKETDDHYIICAHVSATESQMTGEMFILKCAVQAFSILREAENAG